MQFVQALAACSKFLSSLTEVQKRDLDVIFGSVGKQMLLRKFGANEELSSIIGNSESIEALLGGVITSQSAISALVDPDELEAYDDKQDSVDTVIQCPHCSNIFIKEL